ncbi:MAG: DinB family protein [Defluviitaleaceae bacterium]|nr:DinB family protein [Defluviitaleaceae bacterium]
MVHAKKIILHVPVKYDTLVSQSLDIIQSYKKTFGGTNMIESLKALHADWKETRSIILGFLEELSDADLDKILPRKVLNTIRLQAYELTLFQRDIVNSLTTKVVDFGDEYLYENWSKQALAERMADLDAQLEKLLETLDGTEIIDYFGEKRNVHQIISVMIGHENMHVGQIIAFCYATGIEVPKSISEPMALEG